MIDLKSITRNASVVMFLFFAPVLVSNALTYTGITRFTQVWVHNSGHTYLYPNTPTINPDGCTSFTAYKLLKDHPAHDRIFQVVMLSIEKGRGVALYLSGCDGAHPVVVHALLTGST